MNRGGWVVVSSDSSPAPACPGRGRFGGEALEGEVAAGVVGASPPPVGSGASSTEDMVRCCERDDTDDYGEGSKGEQRDGDCAAASERSPPPPWVIKNASRSTTFSD